MTYKSYKHQSEYKLHNLLNSETKIHNTPVKLMNRMTMRPPMSQKIKDSPITNISQSYNNHRIQTSPQQPFSSRFLDFTPIDSRLNKKDYTADFNTRTYNSIKYTPNSDKYRNILKTNQTASDFSYSNKSMRIDHSEQIQELKRQNQDLKRRLSLKVQCNCQAPYIQEQVEYLRDCFYKHIETHHKQDIKK